MMRIAHSETFGRGDGFPFPVYVVFCLNGFLYVLYTIISGEWRELVPNRRSFKEAWLVVLHDLHIRKMVPPQNKYNAAQRIAYTAIIVMGFGSLITGLAIYKPVQFNYLAWICGGYHLARIWHFVLTIGYVLFFLMHIVQVVLAGWNNFRSVISGFEVIDEKPYPLFKSKAMKLTKKLTKVFSKNKAPKKELTVEQKISRRNFISFGSFL
jgi:hypothetical protein